MHRQFLGCLDPDSGMVRTQFDEHDLDIVADPDDFIQLSAEYQHPVFLLLRLFQ